MRKFNFSAGPCTLPVEVLHEAEQEFVDYHGAGMSLMEMSHRSAAYDEVHRGAMDRAKSVFEVPDDFEVLFLGGGATLQFAMVPLNLLTPDTRGGYVDSGAWGKKAIADGSHHGEVYVAWSGAGDGYVRMPRPEDVRLEPDTRYLHVTSNETIHGIRFPEFPDLGVPLVGDMSSDYMSRAIPWELFDVVYGGAQKNLGPAGVDITFVRRSVLEHTNRELASYLRYDVHASSASLHNTPPVFAIYMVGKVLTWMEQRGGLGAFEAESAKKAAMLYEAIDGSDGFYRSPVDPAYRSHMNIVFRLPDEALEKQFLAAAAARDMVNLKGHRSVGGVRASIYNAMPLAGVEALVELMGEFRADA